MQKYGERKGGNLQELKLEKRGKEKNSRDAEIPSEGLGDVENPVFSTPAAGTLARRTKQRAVQDDTDGWAMAFGSLDAGVC